jgi:hypothetical protein
VVDGTPGSLGWFPLTVITRGAEDASPWPREAEAVWQELQAELALLSEHSIHLHAESGDHLVHRSDPDLVVRAIADVVDQSPGNRLSTQMPDGVIDHFPV